MKRLVRSRAIGLHDMRQMLFHLSFGNAEHLGQLVGRQPGAGQKLDDALAHRP